MLHAYLINYFLKILIDAFISLSQVKSHFLQSYFLDEPISFISLQLLHVLVVYASSTIFNLVFETLKCKSLVKFLILSKL